jgi:hypothetical protein
MAQRSPAAAVGWYAGLEKAITKLGDMPERRPIAEEESEQLGMTLRQMLYGRRQKSTASVESWLNSCRR